MPSKPASLDQLGYIQTRYTESFNFLELRKQRWANQLRLLNNLQRGEQNIASTLLLTLFNRTLSGLYDDKIQVKFLPSQGINQDQLNTYNILAQSDYIEMGKAKIDYDWCWDTLFFGRGYMETMQFDEEQKIMRPHVINPLAFGYDPYFPDVDSWRYYWKWISKNKWELDKLIADGTITGVKNTDEISSGMESFLWQWKIIREQARDAIQPAQDSGFQDVFQILEFYTYDENGKKCVYWIDKMFSKILMKKPLDLKDAEDGGSNWPVVIKESFREPHASINFSVADILEDKHRAKSVLLNLAYIAAKDRANPIYLYNPDKVTDVSQFLSRQINQHIPVADIEGAVSPMNTEDPMSQGMIQFISILTTEANEPIGAGTVLQPERVEAKETATASAIDQQLNDMAKSLQSKVMQFGESEFWSDWFHRYRRYGTGNKIANIIGVKGVDSKEIELSDFKTKFPPGVFVYSAKEAEYKELVERRDLMNLYPNLMQTLDQDGMRNFNKYVFFPKFLRDPSLIDVLFPKTIDEMKAEEENEQLRANQMPDVSETDNHQTHIYIHRQSQEKTWALWYHLQWHEDLLAQQKAQEQQMAQMQMQEQQASMGAEKLSPLSQAAPLKTEMSTSGPRVTP